MPNELRITEGAQKWIDKAEEDYKGAIYLIKKTDPPLYNSVSKNI